MGTLHLYTIADCPPCVLLKEACKDERLQRYGISIREVDVGHARELRRELGQIAFPLVVFRRDDGTAETRIGAMRDTVEEEQASLVAWVKDAWSSDQ